MNNVLTFFIGAASSALVFSGYLLVAGDGAGHGRDPSQPGMNPKVAGVESGGLPQRGRTRDTLAHREASLDPKIETVNLLERLAACNPSVVSRMNLYLFDPDLKPQMENWEVLGLDKQEIESITKRLKNTMEEIKNEELKKYTVLQQKDNSLTIGLEPFSESLAKEKIGKIESSFASSLDPELTKILAKKFIDSSPSICAAITGQARIVTVTPTSEDLFKQTGRQFNMEIRTISKETDAKQAALEPDKWGLTKEERLLETIPSSWAHLFVTKK